MIRLKRTLKKIRTLETRYKCALSFIGILTALSLTAELWSNNKPLFLYRDGKAYYPAFFDYPPQEFGVTDSIVVNYHELTIYRNSYSIWPINRWGPYMSDKSQERFPAPPSSTHWLGTDDRGRDILSRLLYGYRYSLIFALAVWLISSPLAAIIGGALGYLGRWYDLLGQRCVEILSTVPQLFLLIFLVSVFEPSLLMLALVTSGFGWIGMSYFIRAEALKYRNFDFIEAARSYGASELRIIFRHILPHSLMPLITLTPLLIISNITGLAVLDYLGFGLPPPTPSWGELLAQAQRYFGRAWWLAIYPSLFLFLTLLSFALIGDALRKILDPRQAHKIKNFEREEKEREEGKLRENKAA